MLSAENFPTMVHHEGNFFIMCKQRGESEHSQFLFFSLMSGSSHFRSVLIGIEYQNCHQTFVVYLLFAILLGQINQN